MKKIFLVFMSLSCLVVESSMLHRSLEYVENPTGKAAVRKSVGQISNVDLPRIANEAWRDFVSVDHYFIDSLINDETKAHGYKPLGLVAEDIKEIEAFIKRFHLSGATQTGIVQKEYLELPYPKLPKFLEDEYDYKNYEIIDSIVSSDVYSYLGPKEIRADVANYLFQKFNKDNKSIRKEKHLFVLKGKNPVYQETLKKNITTILNSMEEQPEYIGNLKENSKISNILYLIICPQDLTDPNLKAKLDNILQNKNLNPGLQVIVAFDDQQKQIPNNFKISDKIKHIAVVGRNITGIGNWFLSNCYRLVSVDLSGLKNVTKLGSGFLSACYRLVFVDLSGFKNVTSIGHSFLRVCNLRSVDLSAFKNVTSIGNSFLDSCIGLGFVDLSVFKNVRKIGNSFLRGCIGLRSVDLSVLKNLTEISDYFLCACRNLRFVDLSVFKNVTKIGEGFLSACSSLASVDLSVFENVTSIGNYFLGACIILGSVDLTVFKNVISIGTNFLFNCTNLHDVTINENVIKLLPANFFDQFLKLKKENIRVIDLNPSYEH